MANEEAIVQAIAPAIRGAITKATQPLLERNEWLEKRLVELEERFASFPTPERGEKGEKGEPGERGEKGADGIGFAASMIDSEGNLAVTNSKGEVHKLGRVVGRDGKDGAQGPRGEQGEKGERGEKGEKGADAEPVSMEVLRDLVREEIAKLPKPKDGEKGERGEKGEPGKDADISELREIVQQSLAGKKDFDPEVIKALIPAPVKGEKGEPGKDGRDGESVTIEDVAPLIKEAIAEEVAKLPKPEKGEKGEKGDAGEKGEDGRDGKDADEAAIYERLEKHLAEQVKALPKPKDGKDGVGIKALHRNQNKELIVTLTDGKTHNCGVVDGERGEAGKDGRDGFGFDDFRTEFDGERRLTLIWEKGEARREKTLVLPIVIGRGPYEHGKEYERGDMVTYGGSTWTAMSEIKGTPKEKDSGWQLTAKKGRDGKDGKGEKGDKGDPGRPGRDLTQMGPDGAKW